MKDRWERVREDIVEGMEEEWSRFRETILEVRGEVCGTGRIKKEIRRKWNETVKSLKERRKIS